jgi:hypothetical protein
VIVRPSHLLLPFVVRPPLIIFSIDTDQHHLCSCVLSKVIELAMPKVKRRRTSTGTGTGTNLYTPPLVHHIIINIMANNKKSNKSKQKAVTRNLNNETIAALKRLSAALKDLDNKGTATATNTATSTATSTLTSTDTISGVPLNHYKVLPEAVAQSYKMLQDAANAIHTISTKYTLMNKINLEDGSKFSTDLRQGCELISTAAFLVHQPVSGCGRSTRTFLKSKSRAIVISVASLVEAFVSGEALNGNVGAQMTGAVWQACEDVERLPKGNRACMRREIFGWVRECNETMEEFQEIFELGPADAEADAIADDGTNGKGEDDGEDDGEQWDNFCNQNGTGEQFTHEEMPIVEASHALIKCSRGVLNVALKACDCAGNAVSSLEEIEKNGNGGDDEDTDADVDVDTDANSNSNSATVRKMAILQWISNLHEISRKIGEGATDLGCVMYPPLNLSMNDNADNTDANTDADDKSTWTRTEIGSQVMEQTKYLLLAAHSINNPIPGDGDGEGQEQIEMSEEVKEMCSKLLSAIERRSNEVRVGIDNVL